MTRPRQLRHPKSIPFVKHWLLEERRHTVSHGPVVNHKGDLKYRVPSTFQRKILFLLGLSCMHSSTWSLAAEPVIVGESCVVLRLRVSEWIRFTTRNEMPLPKWGNEPFEIDPRGTWTKVVGELSRWPCHYPALRSFIRGPHQSTQLVRWPSAAKKWVNDGNESVMSQKLSIWALNMLFCWIRN